MITGCMGLLRWEGERRGTRELRHHERVLVVIACATHIGATEDADDDGRLIGHCRVPGRRVMGGWYMEAWTWRK
jgi:hypothetical protein